MHEQMVRLYQAAFELKKIRGQAALARALNESSQTVNNWETRGISASGLVTAQEKIGCNAIWVRDGVGAMRFANSGADIAIGNMQLENSDSESLEPEEVSIRFGDAFPVYPSFLSDRIAWAIAQKIGREGRKITYADLMRATEVTRAAVSFWKQNKNGIRGETARKAATFLAVDPVWLETGYGAPDGDFSSAGYRGASIPTPIQSSLVTIVGSLVADCKLNDASCMDLLAYIQGVLVSKKAMEEEK